MTGRDYTRKVHERPLRILILGLHYAPEPTGNAPYTTSLARGLAERGHEVHVITGHPHYPAWRIWTGYGQWERKEVIDGVRVTRLRHYVPKHPGLLRRLVSEVSFGFRLLFSRWGRPDVVLMVSPALFSTVLALLRARVLRKKLPVGLWVQDIYSLGMVETGSGLPWSARVMAALEGRTLRSATGVAVIHDRFRSFVTSRLGLDASSTIVIRNWSNFHAPSQVDREAVRRRYGWDPDDIVVLHAGNMGVKQHLDNVLEAARAAENRGAPVRFVLLGDGNQRARLEVEAHDIERLQFISPLPDDEFALALCSADILLVNEFPGVAEMAVPSKLTSYFATGLPVVAATGADSITADEIRASGGGVQIDAGNPGGLVDAVLDLARDPLLRDRLGRSALEFRRRNLTADAAHERHAHWLTGLAKG